MLKKAEAPRSVAFIITLRDSRVGVALCCIFIQWGEVPALLHNEPYRLCRKKKGIFSSIPKWEYSEHLYLCIIERMPTIPAVCDAILIACTRMRDEPRVLLSLSLSNCTLEVRCTEDGDSRNKSPSSLPVERSLILQPPSIAFYAANLLAIVVGHRIISTRPPRVDPMFLDSLKKGPLLLHELDDLTPVQCSPKSIPKEGPDEPAEQRCGECGDAHGDEGVSGDGFGDHVCDGRRDRDGSAAADEGGKRGED
jgi:hypothetical protein